MEKIFDLLDVAIAVLLLVIALSVQLYDNHQVTNGLERKIVPTAGEAELRHSCDGMELAAQLSLLAEKEEVTILYSGKEYRVGEFYENVLGVRLSEEERGFMATEEKRADLRGKIYRIHQQDGKWRIEQ